MSSRKLAVVILVGLVSLASWSTAADRQLIVELQNASAVKFVGAIDRWDIDGNSRSPVNPKAKIDQPAVDATAEKINESKWIFKSLPAGRYDLILLAGDKTRIEGFHYPPVLEFDPVLLHDGKPPQRAIDFITEDIRQARHYENKVTPLFFAGDAKQIRVLVQLLRDKPTSYDRQFGEQVATMRHEVWQYENRYGGWAKERRTRVLDRILMAKRELRQWTWIWEPSLGGIELAEEPVTVSFEVKDRLSLETARGLKPY